MMTYKAGVITLFAFVHSYICSLHFYLGLMDSKGGQSRIKEDSSFNKFKCLILCMMTSVVAFASYVLYIVEKRPISRYYGQLSDITTNNWDKLVNRHSINQEWNIELS